jgi:hypothetical protein
MMRQQVVEQLTYLVQNDLWSIGDITCLGMLNGDLPFQTGAAHAEVPHTPVREQHLAGVAPEPQRSRIATTAGGREPLLLQQATRD